MLSILHIVNWFPNEKNPFEALWIERHVHALNVYCHNTVLHIQVIPSNRFFLIKESKPELRQLILEIPTRSWRVTEWITTILLSFYLVSLKARRYDILNFHIAYPLLTHWYMLRKFYKMPVIISEHWSAYHFNFNVKNVRKLHRIKRIFKQKIPVVSVSKALLADLRKFSDCSDFQGYVVPNVVDGTLFRVWDLPTIGVPAFFLLSHWKWPKDPFTIIKAFSFFVNDTRTNYQLRVGGYGPQEDEMKQLVERLNIKNSVVFLGKLNGWQIANEMNKAEAFLHSSTYETFSVVCAEALSCGTPVIASAVGGIKELVDETNGILVFDNNELAWYTALKNFVETCKFDRISISERSRGYFNSESVGLRYMEVIKEVYDRAHISISSHT